METTAPLSESAVSRWVGGASYSRGQRYARDGAIAGAVREGDTLRATCAGSYQNYYVLWARLGPDGIAQADCDCPVGDGGRCKHVAALLLTWLHHPEAFVDTEPLAATLATKSREELAALVRQMVVRHPDLADLVAMPTPGSGPLDGHALERQVRRALSGDLYTWGAAVRVGRELQRIAGQGEAYAEAGDWASVATLGDVLLDEARAALRAWLRANGKFGVLTEACLHDGDLDEALALLRLPTSQWPWHHGRARLRLAVAQAVAGDRPDEAIQLSLDAVDHLVGQRNRGAYAQASQLLLAVRRLYRQRGRADAWELFLAEFRDGTKQLRALRDEMSKAGL